MPQPQSEPYHSRQPQNLHILPLLSNYILAKGVEKFFHVGLCLKTGQAFRKEETEKKKKKI